MSACARAGGSPAAARAGRARAGGSPRCIVAPSRGRRALPGGRRAVPARCRASSSGEDASIPSLAETSTSSPSSPSSSTRDPGSPRVPSSPSFSYATPALDLDVDAPHADTNARVWYLPNFLDDDAFAAVKAGCDKLRRRMRSDHSFATGRLSAVVPPTSEAYAALCNARALRKLRDASGRLNLVLGDYPVEARLYRPGSSMDWHQDVVLYERPQVELIYTVTNDSDARTEWVGSDGLRRGLAPPANSALAFTAGAAWHRVVGSSEGTRTIVKALYVEDFAKTDAFAEVMEEAPWRR